MFRVGFPGGSGVKNPPANAGASGSIPGQEDLLEKEMETHSSILAWEISGTEELCGLHPMGITKVGCNLGTKQQQHLQGEIWTYIV